MVIKFEFSGNKIPEKFLSLCFPKRILADGKPSIREAFEENMGDSARDSPPNQ
jgi:hypothetical protein